MVTHAASLAPYPKPLKSVETLLAELAVHLGEAFCLEPLPLYTIVVEGWTDVKYLRRAAELVCKHTGFDPLSVDLADGRQIEVGIVTRGQKGDPARGGVKQIVRLAEAIKSACFEYEAYYGIALVFDHDEAGLEGSQQVVGFGFKAGRYSLTLDPKRHPGSSAKKQVVIEDLLSLRIQSAYFDQGTASCSVTYREGKIQRYQWESPSKGLLQEFVCNNADVRDMVEIIRLLARVRKMWGLPAEFDLSDAEPLIISGDP